MLLDALGPWCGYARLYRPLCVPKEPLPGLRLYRILPQPPPLLRVRNSASWFALRATSLAIEPQLFSRQSSAVEAAAKPQALGGRRIVFRGRNRVHGS